MKKLLYTIVMCSLTVFIYLKTDAQVGIFKDKPSIELENTSDIVAHSEWITISYEGNNIDIPYASIAYVIEIKDKVHPERKDNKL